MLNGNVGLWQQECFFFLTELREVFRNCRIQREGEVVSIIVVLNILQFNVRLFARSIPRRFSLGPLVRLNYSGEAVYYGVASKGRAYKISSNCDRALPATFCVISAMQSQFSD